RNVGKAEVSVTYPHPHYCWPQVTTDTGGQVRVYVTQYWNFRGLHIPPLKRAIKPGETITLHNLEVAVESEDRAKQLGEMLVVGTPTICVAPGKYKIGYGATSSPNLATGTLEFEGKEPAKAAAPTRDDVAWGKEVDGLQAGLLAEAATCRVGETLKFTVKLRNVGKAEVSVTYPHPHYCWPQVTTDTGGQVRVYVTQYWNFYGLPIPPLKRAIKPGETITLYNHEVAVESEDRAKQLGEMLVVGTPTICVAPGKYKIVYGATSSPNLATGTLELEIKSAEKK